MLKYCPMYEDFKYNLTDDYSTEDALSQEGLTRLPNGLIYQNKDFDIELFLDSSVNDEPSISKRDRSLCALVRILSNLNKAVTQDYEKEIALEILEAIAKSHPDSCLGASIFESSITPNMNGHVASDIPTLEELVLNSDLHGFIEADFMQGFVCEYARELEKAREYKRALDYYESAIKINGENIRGCLAKCGYHRTSEKIENSSERTKLAARQYLAEAMYNLKDLIGTLPLELNNAVNLNALEGLYLYFRASNSITFSNKYHLRKNSLRSDTTLKVIEQLEESYLNNEQRVLLVKLKAEYQFYLYSRIYNNTRNPARSIKLRIRRLDAINRKTSNEQSFEGKKVWHDLKIRLLEKFIAKYDIGSTNIGEFFIPKDSIDEGLILAKKILNNTFAFTTDSDFAEYMLRRTINLLENFENQYITEDSSVKEVKELERRKNAIQNRLSFKIIASENEINAKSLSVFEKSSFSKVIESLIKKNFIGDFSTIPYFVSFLISNLRNVELYMDFRITSCIPIKYGESKKNNGYLVEIVNDAIPEHWCYFGSRNIENAKICYSPEPVACIILDQNSDNDNSPSSLIALETIFSEQAFKSLATYSLVQLKENTPSAISELISTAPPQLFYVNNRLLASNNKIKPLVSRMEEGQLIFHNYNNA